MPDVSAGIDCSGFPSIGGRLNSVQNTFRRNDLIGPHDKQQFFRCEHAVFCQNIQQRVLRKEGLGKVHKIRNDPVISISPVRSKLETVGGFLAALLGRVVLLPNMACSGGIGIILGECSI